MGGFGMNVLAVGAHFDDVELGCSGSLRRHVERGDRVVIYVATGSGFSGPDQVRVRDSAVAQAEGKAAAERIGAQLVCGGFETLLLEFEEELNGQLSELIRREHIDLLYTHYDQDVHHDHIALARASLHAGRDVPRILQYRSNWYQSAVRFTPDFFEDITDTWETKQAAILEHRSEYERVGDAWLSFFKNDAEKCGCACGVRLAEGFRCVRWLLAAT